MKNKKTENAKRYQIKKSSKTNKNEKVKTKKTKKHSKLKKVILVLFILMFVVALAGIGALAGIFFSDKWSITKEELIANGNTEVYDSEGKQIALLSSEDGDSNRKVITIDQMGKYTVNAYVAIEDKRFYEHSGIDIIRTTKATASYILHRGSGSDVGGASTITQQLVKNIMNDDADSGAEGIERKIREMSRAYKIEQMLTKEQIIEKYLNVIFVGGSNLHGIEYGAKYYFAKSAKDLDLAESAFLAGINNGPNMYDPYDEEDHSELIESRTKLVLYFMKEQNRISDDPEEAEKLYNEAIEKVEKGFEFKKGKFEFGNTSYFVEEAISEVAKDLAELRDIKYSEAENIIKSGGYKLYTTQVSSIQKTVIKEMAKSSYGETRKGTVKDENGKSKTVTYKTNAGMTIIEPRTGKVVAMGGALGSDQGTNINFAKTERQTGSSIKPLVNIAPGLEEKIITAATVFDDSSTQFKGLNYIPQNAGGYQGLCTVRKAIEVSSNIVNMKIMYCVGLKTALNYLHEFGLTTYTEENDSVITLSIGGANHGSSTLQMAGAYACLANGGMYIEPTFYDKLVDREGDTVIESKQETRRVISEANAFIISDILTDVVTGYSGTAGVCAISGMDVAAKTGTTDAATNKWLCGYTPYYAAATWYGYADGEWTVYDVNTAKNIWANVMKEVHKNLEKKRFIKPSGVVTAKVCKDSGKLATASCKNTYTEYFAKGTVPKACDGHVTVKLCKTSGKVATPYCLEIQEKLYTAKPEMENNVNWTALGKNKYNIPKDKCTIHTEETSTVVINNLIGKTEEEAKAELDGLNVQVIYEKHGDQTNGVVIRQSLAEGTRVQKGVSFIITVNKFEVPTPTPTPTKTPTPTPAPTINEEIVVNTNTTEDSNALNAM